MKSTAHRPWPVPDRRWVMVQTWTDLLFAHWPVDPGSLRSRVPSQLPIDTYDGAAWLGITPFELSLLRPRAVPIPLVWTVPELNVRTYVTLEQKPGVYFFSLDIGSLSAVIGARTVYGLPYYRSSMHKETREGEVQFGANRIHGPRPARFDITYAPISEASASRPGTLEYFLAERYCLYTAGERRRVYRAEIHHLSWPLQNARAEIRENTMATAAGISLPQTPPVTHFSRELHVLVWLPKPIRNGRDDRA